MKDTQITVVVQAEFADYIDAQVRAGPFRDSSEYVASLIRMDYLAFKYRERRERDQSAPPADG